MTGETDQRAGARPDVSDDAIVAARRALLDWFAGRGRSLPGRDTRDPWHVLVLEVASQQTQIDRALEAARRFVALFPSPAALAARPPADAVRAWSGLGYNRRAVALWRAARLVVDEHGGRLPEDPVELERLPGIGPYTARAVAVHAFGRRCAPLDVNLRRVVGRFFGEPPPAALQALADDLLDSAEPSRSVHALMDLAALVCRRRPACDACPLATVCLSAHRVAAEPARRRPARPAPPFEATRRWLRGQLLREIVATPPDAWLAVGGPRGSHDGHAVRQALATLVADGLVELDDEGRARLAQR